MRFSVIPFVSFWLSLVSASLYSGADFSSLLLMESTANAQFKTSSTAESQPFEKILYDAGVNLARIRIWTSGTYNLSYGLELGKRAKAVGMDLMIALFYDDTWADPGHQAIPVGWPTDLEGLVSQVYNYTYTVVEAFNAQGTPVQYVQVGNEIADGLLWPTGQISVNGFIPASKLLHAGINAVRNASSSTKTVIQLDNGWDQAFLSWFYNGILSVGDTANATQLGLLTTSDVDVMGVSMYPYYGGSATLGNLASALDYLVSTYKKEIMVVETDWPVECDTQVVSLSEPSIPVSTEGQVEWVNGIAGVLHKVIQDHSDDLPNGTSAVIYWEPGFLWNTALASPCADVILVNSDGVLRSSISLFSDIRKTS